MVTETHNKLAFFYNNIDYWNKKGITDSAVLNLIDKWKVVDYFNRHFDRNQIRNQIRNETRYYSLWYPIKPLNKW